MIGGDPKWSKGIDLISKRRIESFLQLCRTLKDQMPLPPTPKNLSAKPGAFIPFLAMLLSTLEDRFYNTPDEDKKPRLFSLLPNPSLHWRYVHINTKALSSNIKDLKYSSGFHEEQKLFHQTFDFS